jgi:hypothetical protein
LGGEPWIIQEMISKMDEGRKWKNVNNEDGRKNYKRLYNELRKATKPRWNTLKVNVTRLRNCKEQEGMI